MVTLNKIATYLNQFITGAVYDAPNILESYATDQSILKIRPRAVALPKTTQDIRKLARFSNQLATKNFKLPITVRGTGLDKTGAALGSGIIVSMENFNQVQEIDPRQRLVRVQTGITLGELNTALALHSLTLPVSAHPDQTIGGLIANYHKGSLSAKYGPLANYVYQAEIVLSTGDVIQTERLSPRHLNKKKGLTGFEGELYRRLDNLISDHPDLSLPKNSLAGYPALLKVKSDKGSFDLLPLFSGSQGTLGIITEVILNCEMVAPPEQYIVAVYNDVKAALEFLDQVEEFEPSEVNICDVNLFRTALEHGKRFRPFKKLPENGIVVSIKLNDSSNRRRTKKLKRLTAALDAAGQTATSTSENYANFEELSSIISVYLNELTRSRRIPLVDGASIPEGQLKRYFAGVVSLEEKYQIKLPIFGSALTGHYSVRPEIDLTSVAGRQFVLAFLRDYNEVVVACGGSLAGDSAEGRVKAICTNLQINPELAAVNKELKAIFDPNSILNPDIKQTTTLRAVVRQLRTSYDSGIISD